ncbi:hypothetical protein [Phycobium rhodophyticola]
MSRLAIDNSQSCATPLNRCSKPAPGWITDRPDFTAHAATSGLRVTIAASVPPLANTFSAH